MCIGLFGIKLKNQRIFDSNNFLICSTIIKIIPGIVNTIKTKEKNGYYAVSLLYYIKFKNKLKQNIKIEKEYKQENIYSLYNGQIFDINLLNTRTTINIRAKSIGKGFSGNIKKNHFSRGPVSHGSKHHRLQGSLGAGTSPGRVFPGKKMSGRLGCYTTTIYNLEILKLDKKQNLIFVKGSIPGKKFNFIDIY